MKKRPFKDRFDVKSMREAEELMKHFFENPKQETNNARIADDSTKEDSKDEVHDTNGISGAKSDCEVAKPTSLASRLFLQD